MPRLKPSSLTAATIRHTQTHHIIEENYVNTIVVLWRLCDDIDRDKIESVIQEDKTSGSLGRCNEVMF